MKKIVLTVCIVFAACMHLGAGGEEDGVEDLRRKLAEQEALLRNALDSSVKMQTQMTSQAEQLNDMNAKMRSLADKSGGSPQNVVSMRKNAKVTIGGTLTTRYNYRDGEVRSSLVLGKDPVTGDDAYLKRSDGKRRHVEDYKSGDLRIKDAKVAIKIDINEHIDGYIRLDLQDMGRANVSGIGQYYWLRWKNIRNSGFGVLIGRDALKFGDNSTIGVIASWNKSAYDSATHEYSPSAYRNHDGTKGNGMFALDNLMPMHTTFDFTRTTQINPYWESSDGKWKVDVSIIQAIDRLSGLTGAKGWVYDHGDHNLTKYRSINYGIGSATARVVWKPIEGAKIIASAMNLYAQDRKNWVWGPEGRRDPGSKGYGVETTSNNSAVNLAVQYRPAFLKKLNIWGQWTHGWNEAWVDGMDSDSLNFGASYDFTSRLTYFAQGDYLYVKNPQSEYWHKATGWAFYTGVVYTLPHGLELEGGWRHEQINYKDRADDRHTVFKADTIYAHLKLRF